MRSRFLPMKIGLPILCVIGLLLLWNAAPPPSSAQGLERTLQQSWQFYKNRFMVNGERVESEYYQGTITEGQSYALLKAAWMNDPETFEKTWNWTRTHMRRPEDHLFGWRWGLSPRGEWELLEMENAADADQDIAYALLLAGEQWNRPDYLDEAKGIIRDLWRLNVQNLNGKYYLLPGTWEGFRQEYLTVNPSYFAPYIYRKFAAYDPPHASGWQALANEVYATLETCSNLTANGLPPNWCAIQWQDNGIAFSDKQGPGSRDFSYDAFRVFWRMAMDAALGGAESKRYLKRHAYLLTHWQKHNTLPEGFSPNGHPLGSQPSGFALSAALAQSHILSSADDATLYQKMLQPYYHSEGYWFNAHNDFLHSVIWLHLYTVSLP